MKYEILKTDCSLNDPEKGFTYSFDDCSLTLKFTDWQNKIITILFTNVFKFTFQYASTYKGLPEGEMLQIEKSEDISQLISDHCAGEDDELKHYVISTNEDQWCEVIANSHRIEISAQQGP